MAAGLVAVLVVLQAQMLQVVAGVLEVLEELEQELLVLDFQEGPQAPKVAEAEAVRVELDNQVLAYVEVMGV